MNVQYLIKKDSMTKIIWDEFTFRLVSVKWLYYSIYVTNAPPLVNNTNPETKTGFVLFFSNDYFGIKIDLDGKSNKTDCKSAGFVFDISVVLFPFLSLC